MKVLCTGLFCFPCRGTESRRCLPFPAFERIEIKDEFEGTPAYAYQSLEAEIARVNLEIEDLDKQAGEMLSDRAPQLIAARNRLEELSNNFDVRKLAARMEDNKEDYYILCGWMAEDDVEKFLKEVEDDDKVFVVVEMTMTPTSESPPLSWRIRNCSNL